MENIFCFRKNNYECPFCFFTFNTKKELKIHKRKCLFSDSKNISNILFENKEIISKPPPHK